MAELRIEQDALRDTVTINGIVYSRAMFEDFGATMPLGRLFRLVSRENSVLTIEYLPDGVTGASALRPLTLDRIEELWEALEHKAPVYLARAVEAAHGIGVGGPEHG